MAPAEAPGAVLLNHPVTRYGAKDAPVAVAEVESAQNKRQLCGGSQAAIERMIHFGRELQSMSEHLRRECGKNSANKKMLKVKRVLITTRLRRKAASIHQVLAEV